jgi:hypothetical protein
LDKVAIVCHVPELFLIRTVSDRQSDSIPPVVCLDTRTFLSQQNSQFRNKILRSSIRLMRDIGMSQCHRKFQKG